MSMILALPRSLSFVVRFSLISVLMIWLLSAQVSAQTSATDGQTPLALSPGAPAGSYALSDFDNINFFNGNLNFRLPLMRIGGRGSVGYTMTLPIENRWTVDHYAPETGLHSPNYNWWTGLKPGYGPGVLQGRQMSELCDSPQMITRLTFTAPDGTEIEFRDQATGGKVKIGACINSVIMNPTNRGKVFVSVDGSAATFVSDNDIIDYTGGAEPHLILPTGYLLLKDGTRYRIQNGTVSWMADRNGNKVSFTYEGGFYTDQRVTSITDSLNRQVTICYAFSTACNVAYDQITFKGFGGGQRQIRVWYNDLGNVLRASQSGDPTGTWTYSALFSSLSGSSSTPHNPKVISSVELPDGQRFYQFKYNQYGELARVELPTTGVYEYDWTGWVTSSSEIVRRVITRRVFPDGGTGSAYTIKTTYSTNQGTSPNSLFVVEQRNASGALLAQSKHFFYGDALSSLFSPAPYLYPPWADGREYQTQSFDTNGTTVLRQLEKTWEIGTPISTNPTEPINVRTKQAVTKLMEISPALVTKQTFFYDQYNNQIDVYEFDYGSGGPPTYAKRHTHTDYLTTNPVNGAAYDNPPPVNPSGTLIHLRSLALRQKVYEVNPSTGAETWAAQTEYEYDKYDTSANHAALTNRTNISGLDSAFTTSYTARGNVTQADRWRNSSGSLKINTYAQYDIAGNTVKAIDGRGNATTLDFTDRFGAPTGEARANTAPSELGSQSSFGFATKVTNALGQMVYTQFDYYLSHPVDGEDANGVVSSGVYNDLLDRPTQVIRANTATPADSKKNQTTFDYTDASRKITTTSDQSAYNDNLLKNEIFYDGLGRTTEQRTYLPATGTCPSSCYSVVKTTYDPLGRVSQVSNPYRPGAGETALWTTTQYDALGRVVSVTTPDGAAITTAYSSNKVLVTDPASKQRLSQTNALGQMTDVWEIRAADGATESVSFPGYPSVTAGYRSKYIYDVLDSLTTMTQQIGTSGTTQARSFVYDPLKRLTSATNPESGAITYQYDNNGNLTSKTDARSITTTINYDALNRPTTKTYSDGTPVVAYFYDNQTLPTGAPSYSRGSSIGRMVAVTYSGGSLGNYYGYDTLGRATIKYQRLGTTNYQVQAGYNLSGAMTSETYPSGRTVSYSYDAAGRVSNFSGTLGDGLSRTYASITQYSAAGLKERESYGTGLNGMTKPLYLKLHYNKRQQLVDLRLGSVNDEWNWNRGALTFYYGTNAVSYWNPFQDDTDNNGNVRRAFHYAPATVDGSDINVTSYVIPGLQDYTYDELNRIQSVIEAQQDAAGTWAFNVVSQTFSYDRYGNRKITAATGGVNNYNPTYDLTTNRINGLIYDTVGNITTDAATGGTMTYDAENRLLTASNGGGGSYTYDGEGKRVKRQIAGQEWWYVYGIGGELLAEYLWTSPTTMKKEYGYRDGQVLVVWNGDETGDKRLKWLVQDHLGSTRMEADLSGSLTGMRRHDYLPFGEELYAGLRRNPQGQGQYGYEPPQSTTRQRFAGKERDTETGLDFFEARYFSNVQGRFTSIDPLRASARISNPQTLNRYSYVLNRPTVAVDPDGLSTIIVTVTQHGNANPTASVRLVRTRGDSAGTTVGASHDSPGNHNGLAAGVGGRNRMVENSDTPFGVYRRRNVATAGGRASSRLGDAYGTGQVLMDPLAGEVTAAGRTGILIHGGGTAVRTAGGDPYAPLQDLHPTRGCVRLHNGDVNLLIQNVNSLEGTEDALDRVFIGTAESLRDRADQRDANGNYLNPDLRIALGLYSTSAELQQLVQADQARRQREEAARRRREEERRRRQQQQ